MNTKMKLLVLALITSAAVRANPLAKLSKFTWTELVGLRDNLGRMSSHALNKQELSLRNLLPQLRYEYKDCKIICTDEFLKELSACCHNIPPEMISKLFNSFEYPPDDFMMIRKSGGWEISAKDALIIWRTKEFFRQKKEQEDAESRKFVDAILNKRD